MSKFGKFCKIFFGIFAVLVVLAWVFLWVFLRDYENSVSIRMVEQIVKQYQDANGKALLSHLDIKTNNYEDAQQFSEYIDYIVGGAQVKYAMVTTGSYENPEYLISVGDATIEKLVLEPVGKTWLGHKQWKIQSETTSFEPLYNGVTINAPSNADIQINGITLTDLPVERNVVLGLYENTPKGSFKPLFHTYTIDGFFCEPKITAQGKNGEECMINKDEETGTIYITTPATDEQYQLITKLTESFSASYYEYISGKSDFEVLRPYIYENCEFFDYIKSQNVKKLVGSDSSRLESVHVDNCQSYDDSQLSCDVSFNFVYTINGEEHEYPSAYEINYILSDGDFKVVNLVAK